MDLPTLAERQEIVTVHLRKRNRFPQEFDIVGLAKAAEGYVGAEIEQAIIDGMYVGFNQGREVTTADILTALRRQVPLSVSQVVMTTSTPAGKPSVNDNGAPLEEAIGIAGNNVTNS